MNRACKLVALCFIAWPSVGWTQSLDEIVVTASRTGWRDLSETPAISITKPGDFLLQQVLLVNDTRDKQSRHNELSSSLMWMRIMICFTGISD